jgi:branched-chain amino acid transport system substrate-binding protein
MSKTKRNALPPIVWILLGIVALFSLSKLPNVFKLLSELGGNFDRMSLGNLILIPSESTVEKQAGVEAFAKHNYTEATQNFQASLRKKPNDPETLIYFNNANASDANPLKIAVSVPIRSNVNVAQEILRGVAQAQNAVNTSGGINGSKLQVEILDDENSPEIAKKLAENLVKDNKVLAVVGHNSSNASLSAAPIYQKAGLVMITPTSFANDLSGFGSAIFRTIPNIRSLATPLADYIVKSDRHTQVAVCYDAQSLDNSFKDEFITSLNASGGQLTPILCDFSAPTFNAKTVLQEAANKGAEAILLAPHIDRIEQAISVARANRGKLPLYGSATLYTMQTLEEGQNHVEGLILPVPWHPQAYPNNSFTEAARQLWGGTINWRTATSFDATQAIIAALQQDKTRNGIQKILRSPSFSAVGSGEEVRFLSTGDRASKPILVRIQSDGKNGYIFAPLP